MKFIIGIARDKGEIFKAFMYMTIDIDASTPAIITAYQNVIFISGMPKYKTNGVYTNKEKALRDQWQYIHQLFLPLFY